MHKVANESGIAIALEDVKIVAEDSPASVSLEPSGYGLQAIRAPTRCRSPSGQVNVKVRTIAMLLDMRLLADRSGRLCCCLLLC